MKMNGSELRILVTRRLAAELGVAPGVVDPDATAYDLGLGSVGALRIAGQLEADLGIPLQPHLLFDYPTVNSLVRALTDDSAGYATADTAVEEPIAIVGIGCRFPGGVVGPDQFLAFLRSGGDGIVDVPSDRWDSRKIADNEGVRIPTDKAGFIPDLDRFDAALFGILPNEAVEMDPQQRMLLETAWHALEDAGYDPKRTAGAQVGVFVGISTNEYERGWPLTRADLGPTSPASSASSIAANRLSYVFDWRGPSIAIDTACSSSLNAVHFACQALRRGEARIGLAGGVNTVLTPDIAVAFDKAGLMAPDGLCKSFDDSADGYVRGEGCGLVVLKRLADAMADGNPIYAVILGSAVGQDGRSNGLMAPRGDAQSTVIADACAKAGINPAEIDYIETHGTGTAVGDVIEAHAISAVAAPGRPAERPLVLGSVKSNIGHLEAAAGIAGLIKTALCISAGEIVPNRHFNRANRRIDFDRLQLTVATAPAAWPVGERRIAGVSSFGFGGSNVHAILAAAPSPAKASALSGVATSKLLLLSGNTAAQLSAVAHHAAGFLGDLDDAEVDCALRAYNRRHAFAHRAAIHACTRDELAAALRAIGDNRPSPHLKAGIATHRPRVAFVFPGQGALWARAGLELFEASDVYRDALIACDEHMRVDLGRSVLDVLFSDNAAAAITKTEFAQPALFAVQYGLTALLRTMEIRPDGVIGHSVGEIAAACAAEKLSLKHAAELVVRRSRAMADTAGCGRMLAVRTSVDWLTGLLPTLSDRVQIAAINGPNSVVLSGDVAAIAAIEGVLKDQDVACLDLGLNYAFHSHQMEPAAQAIRDFECHSPKLVRDCAYYSSVTGDLFADQLDGAFWARNIRDTVQFEAAIQSMKRDGFDLFVEIAPTSVLSHDIVQSSGLPTISLMKTGQDARKTITNAAAELFARGVIDNPSTFFGAGQALRLPPYPMGGETYWRVRRVEPVNDIRLLGATQIPAFAPDHRIRCGQISLKAAPWVQDHSVRGSMVVPATGLVSLFGAIVDEAGPTSALCLNNLSILEPIVLNADENVPIQLCWRDDPQLPAQLFRQRNGQWQKFAEVLVSPAPAQTQANHLNIDAIKAQCFSNFPGGLFYNLLRSKGLEYGLAYRLVTEVHACRGEAIALIDQSKLAERRIADPEVLDACLHVIAAAISPKQLQDQEDPALYVPAAAARVTIFDKSAQPHWSHAIITQRDSDRIAADVTILDLEQNVIAAITGLELKSLRGERKADGLAKLALGNWIHRVGWVETPVPGEAQTQRPATVVMLCDQGGLGQQAAEALAAAGSKVIRIHAGTEFEALASDHFRVPVSSRAAFDQVLARLGVLEIDAIIDFWPLDSRYGDCPSPRALELGPKSLVALVQAMAGSSMRGSGQLTVVTRRAVAVTKDEDACPHQATISGLIRAIGIEYPGLKCKSLDLTDDVDPRAILDELGIADGESQIALRKGQRFGARLQKYPVATPEVPALRDEAAYLITGGMGALGLTAASSLAQAGAKQLILVGRTPPSPVANAVIKRLREGGVTVTEACLDIADRLALDAFCAGKVANGASIAGIVHCAGVLDDCAIANLTPDRLDRVLAPKLLGALNLHEASLAWPLDFFVLYSSAAAVLGAPGQANYCSANAGLDALAIHRRRNGLAGLSIGWGAWSGAGMAKEAASGIVGSTLLSAIPHDVGGELLKHCLAAEGGHLMIVPFSIPSMIQFYPSNHGLKLFAEIVGSKMGELRSEGAKETRYQRPALSTAYQPPRTAIERRIAKIWESSLTIEGIGVTDDIFELGGDSVLANQILSKISEVYGVRTEGEKAFQSFTIENLARLVDEELIRFVEQMGVADPEVV